MFICVCVFASFISFHISLYWDRAPYLCSKCKIDKFDFADWMAVQPFILCEISSLIKKLSLKIPKAIYKHEDWKWNRWKDKNNISKNALTG